LFLLLLKTVSASPAPSTEPLPPLSGNILYGISKHLVLKPGESDRSWEYRFEVPEGDGRAFPWMRAFKTEGDLIVEEEALSQNTYSVRVHLQGDPRKLRTGSFHMWMKKRLQTPPDQPPPAPEIHFHSEPLEPCFDWRNPTETLAISLFNRATGALMYQEVITRTALFELWGVTFKMKGRYLLIAAQSDAWGRYSPALNLAFRIDAVKETCTECDGEGVDWGNASPGSPTPPVCPLCKGSGVWKREVFIPEELPPEID
jgi:hypothetical protein